MTEEKIFEKDKVTRAVLVSVIPKGADEREYDVSFDELARLADTAEAQVVARLTQQKEIPMCVHTSARVRWRSLRVFVKTMI